MARSSISAWKRGTVILELAGLTAFGIAGSTICWITGAPAGGAALYGVAGPSPSTTTGGSAVLSSSEVNGSTTSAAPWVAPAVLKLQPRPKLHTSIDSEGKEIQGRTSEEGNPRAISAAGRKTSNGINDLRVHS